MNLFFVNAGRIPVEESARNAIAQWANDCERKLLGLNCGQMLERSRHTAWADAKMADATIVAEHRDFGAAGTVKI